jgi:hypothetical protein
MYICSKWNNLITTKSGKKNSKAKVSIIRTQVFRKLQKAKPTECHRYAFVNESYANGGQTIPYLNNQVWGRRVENCIKYLGSDKVTYSVSGSHLDQEGIIGGNKSGF